MLSYETYNASNHICKLACTQFLRVLYLPTWVLPGLSEVSLPGAIVGETFANIIGEQFRRIKFGDRFWHETNNRVVRFTTGKFLFNYQAS